MKVLLVGVTGQIGSELYESLHERGFDVVGLARTETATKLNDDRILSTDLESLSVEKFQDLCFDAAIHLADTTYFSAKKKGAVECFRSNLKKAKNFISLCRATKVKKIIYVSSSGVYGDKIPAIYVDEYAPMMATGWYQRGKIAVERKIRKSCSKYGISYVIVRPPLVYSENAKGKFKWLLEAVHRKIPLPRIGEDAKRSMISTDHLGKFLCHCLTSAAANNQTFNVADGVLWTYPELVHEIASAMNVRYRLFRMPMIFRRVIGCFKWGKRVIDSLECPHILNTKKAENLLEWDFGVNGKSRVEYVAKRYALKKSHDESDAR